MGNKMMVVTCDTVMSTELPPVRYCVETLISQGLFVLAGEPKIGKSKLSLDMCLSVAKGKKVLGQKTVRGAALYLALEDTLVRLQNRLFELTDEPVDNVFFSLLSASIGGGLEQDIEGFYREHSDLRLVIIDTLQKVRNSEESSYGSDYKEVSILKNLADKLGITIILIHHTRKQKDTNPFNMISGSTGLRGVADGAIVLLWENERELTALLFAEGRDIPKRRMQLRFNEQTQRWEVLADDLTEPEKFDDEVVTALVAVMKEEKTFLDTATVLAERINNHTKKKYDPKVVSRIMTQNQTRLEQYGIMFERRHSNGRRRLSIEYIGSTGADGDDKNMVCAAEVIVPIANGETA